MTIFKPYSSAAKSKSAQEGQSLTKVLAMGNWRTTSTFFHFYLWRIKYFKCKNSKTDADKGAKRNTVRSQLSSPVQRKAANVLTKSLRKVRKVNRTIHVEL